VVNTAPPTISGGRYQIIGSLGAGAMGIVYRALDKLTGHYVALKQVKVAHGAEPADQADDMNVRLALAEEFQTLASLRHPHIISVLDYGFDGTRPYFTMDLLENPQPLLAAGQDLSLAGKVDLLVQILQALAYSHRRGVLHRDVKPGNVMVCDNQVKVVDFGLSKQIAPAGSIVGTPAYIAPELLQSDPATPASDLYAVGVMAYELLTGQHPFDTSSMRQLFHEVINLPPDLNLLELKLKDHVQPPALPDTLPELDVPPAENIAPKPLTESLDETTRPSRPLNVLDGTTRVVPKEYNKTTRPNVPADVTHPRIRKEVSDNRETLEITQPHYEHPLTTTVRKLLDKSPQDRYTDASSVIRDLSVAIGIPLPVETVATRESFLQAAEFVGRDAEFAGLETALTAAMTGQGSVWLVAGESGVGKSRLLNEVRTHALVAGSLVMRGQAIGEAGSPYHIWREPLRRLCLITDLSDTDAGVLRSVVPDIGDLLGREITPITPELDPEQSQRRLTSVIASILHRQSRPILLILEDLHWAGSESLSVLQQISQSIADLSLLILASYRDDESPTLPQLLAGTQVLKLDRLKPADIAALSQSMLGEAGKQPDVLHLLQHETEGNVFFLVEVVRALAEEAGQLDKIGLMTLPAHVFAGGVQQIIQRRLNRVPVEAFPMLQIAAALGRQIDLSLLRTITPDQDLEAWLGLCNDAAVLEFQDEYWRFAHDKLREGALAILQPPDRAALHQRIAVAIESFTPDQVIALAYHWGMAGNTAQELRYVVLAGEQADRVSAFREAVDYFMRALAILGESADNRSQRASLMVQLGRVYARLNSHAESSHYLNESLSLAQEIQDRRIAADALSWLGNVARAQGLHDDAARYYGESLTISREIGGRRTMADALRGLARIAAARGQYAEANQRFEESLSISRQIDDPLGMAHALSDLALVATMQGAHTEAAPRLEESLQIFTKIGDRRGMAKALLNLGMAAQYQGLPAKGMQQWQESLAISREIGDRWSVAATLNNLGYAALMQGNYTQVETYLLESLDIFRDLGDRASAVQTLVNLGHAASALDDNSTAAERFRDALEASLAMDIIPLILEILAGTARLCVKAGNPVLALELVGLTLHHPGTNSDIKALAEPLLNEIRGSLSPDRVQRALERGESHDLKAMAEKILTEFLAV
jgi:serine/threonine protein kinase/tetratricopeptide (TPR) repeat protein